MANMIFQSEERARSKAEGLSNTVAVGRLAASRSVGLSHPENHATLRVAEKCGYRELRRTTYRGQPAIICAR